MHISSRIVAIVGLFLCAWNCPAQTKRALLIGINTYESKAVAHASIKTKVTNGPTRWTMHEWPNLKGALNDVKAMKAVLTSPKFGFPKDDEHMHLLLQNDATREGILATMRKYLVDLPGPGDIVVFYYSGHGSLRVNSLSEKDLRQGGMSLDNTIVPVDANTGAFDVRDREIARIFNAALDKGVILTAIFDSCHSGAIARGVPVGTSVRTRFLPYDPRDIHEAPDMKNGKPVPAPADRSDNAALILSASLSHQTAKEWDSSNGSYGAFTVALVAALQAVPADIPAKDAFKRISVVMKGMGIVDQDPRLEGTEHRRQQPLFGKGSVTGKLRIASEGMDDDGVVLNAGFADSLGVGSELISVSGEKGSPSVRIRIYRVDGLTRSHAKVVSAANANVEAGDLFELDKWVPDERTLLPLWLPPGNLSTQQIQDVVVQLREFRKNPRLTLIDDPARQLPTHMISWDGKQWTLSGWRTPGIRSLGTSLKASALGAKLSGPDAKLLVNLPPSDELIKQLGFNRDKLPVKVMTDPQAALYVLIGSFDGQQVRYAWFRKTALEEAKRSNGDVNGACAPDSPYPIRSDWVSLSASNEKETPGRKLAELAARIDKAYAWLNLPTPPVEEALPFPYKLALRRRSDSAYLDNAQSVEGDQLDLLLKTDGPVSPRVAPRWVYVLSIDCTGKGILLYPRSGSENKYPRAGDHDSELSLARLRIVAPFGTDTYILLTTAEQLPDPAVLNFEAAVTSGARGSSALQNLFGSASRGIRGGPNELPTSWSIQRVHLTSSAATPTKTQP